MTTLTNTRAPGHVPPAAREGPSGLGIGLSGAAALCSAVAAGWTFTDPELLTGPAVMNGSARGTALVVLVLAVPVLLISMVLTVRGSQRAVLTWLGALGYLVYNALLLLFLTPFNDAFLLYVAMLSTALWAVVSVLRDVRVESFVTAVGSAALTRGVAIYVWVVVTLNAGAWLAQVVPALGQGDPSGFLDGTGVRTNVIYIQDLAIWLPLMAVAAGWLWRRSVWGFVVITSVQGMWVIESVSVAVDQWFGHRADPASSLATIGGSWLFAALAVIGLVPLFLLMRAAGDASRPGQELR